MIEAELKARLARPEAVRAALAGRAAPERATYRDTYYDTARADLDRAGREVRLRTVETAEVRHLLTVKEPAVDPSGSKPEFETTVGDPAVVRRAMRAAGLRPLVELTKECENYRFGLGGRDLLATVVRVPELDGTFLEVETMAEEGDVGEALVAVRRLLRDLGVTEAELTLERYTDAVREHHRAEGATAVPDDRIGPRRGGPAADTVRT